MRMLKKLTSVLLAVGVLMSLAACGDNSNNSNTPTGEPQRTFPSEVVTAIPKDADTQTVDEVVAAEDGPRVYIGDTTAKAGEYAEVVLYVENADRNWSFCGLHITYPDILEPKLFEDEVEDNLVDFERGSASRRSSGATAVEWVDNVPEELTSNNLGCFFFAEMFADDYGLDGDIAKFWLKIPEDAESGTVYPLSFYYLSTDAFQNSAGDLSLQKYTFENLKDGSITVE